jgi:hypothetical protein
MEVYVPLILYMFIDIEFINPPPSQGRQRTRVNYEEKSQAKIVMKGMVSREEFLFEGPKIKTVFYEGNLMAFNFWLSFCEENRSFCWYTSIKSFTDCENAFSNPLQVPNPFIFRKGANSKMGETRSPTQNSPFYLLHVQMCNDDYRHDFLHILFP